MRGADGRFRAATLDVCTIASVARHHRAAIDACGGDIGNVLGKISRLVRDGVFPDLRGVAGGGLSGDWSPLSGPVYQRAIERII